MAFAHGCLYVRPRPTDSHSAFPPAHGEPRMQQVIWKYGLLAGVILAALMFLTIPFIDTIGSMGIVLGYATMLIGFSMIFFGIRAYRNGEGGGTVTFGRGFLIGLAIT